MCGFLQVFVWKTNFDLEDWQSALGEETSGLNETVAELNSPVKCKVDARSAMKELQQPNVQVLKLFIFFQYLCGTQ